MRPKQCRAEAKVNYCRRNFSLVIFSCMATSCSATLAPKAPIISEKQKLAKRVPRDQLWPLKVTENSNLFSQSELLEKFKTYFEATTGFFNLFMKNSGYLWFSF